MNTEERQLAEMLHRVTPEPPRRVTVEDVAFRLASEPGPARGGTREPRARGGIRGGIRGRGWGRGWAPVLAAASVFVVAGATAGIAAVATSHHAPSSPASSTPSAAPVSSSSASSSASSSPSVQRPASVQPTWPPTPIAGGPWSAELINPDTLGQDSLTGSGNSLYAIASGYLNRINPVTGNVLASAQYSAPVAGPPVVAGNTVWVVSSYGGSNVVLHGYNGATLAQVASVTVPVSGQVSSAAQGVLTAGPDGNLYLAAGDAIAVVNPSSRQVTRTITVSAGPASSVAVSPDGSRLYVSTFATAGQTFSLLVYDNASAMPLASSSMSIGGGGNLVATSGGVWGTVGTGMSGWVWFAPGGDLSHSFRVTRGAGAGLASVPTFSGGAVWIGGSHTLACADPATGKILASATILPDRSVLRYFGRVTVLGGHAYSDYLDNRAQRAGVARMTPPAACSG